MCGFHATKARFVGRLQLCFAPCNALGLTLCLYSFSLETWLLGALLVSWLCHKLLHVSDAIHATPSSTQHAPTKTLTTPHHTQTLPLLICLTSMASLLL